MLAARVGPVYHLVAVCQVCPGLDGNGGLHHRSEAGGHLAELQPHICDHFTLHQRDGGQIKGVIVGAQKVGRQHAVVVVIGPIGDPVVQPRVIGACRDGFRGGAVGGEAVVPEEVVQRHIGGIGHCEIIAHGVAGQQLLVARLGDGYFQIGGLVVVADLDDLAGILQGFVKGLSAELIIGRGSDPMSLN